MSPLNFSFSIYAVSGAYLTFNDSRLSGSPPNVQLPTGDAWRVYCVHWILLPTEWYNPEGQLVSRNKHDAVNQASSSIGAIPLTFRSYQESQGGRYECRVDGRGDTLEKLPVCIGETQMDNHKINA